MSIFLSHISEEAKIALAFKEWIESIFIGIHEVFVSSDIKDLPAGSRWLENIESALDNSKILIVLCSPKSIKRTWINFEAGCGWIKKIPVIPVCHSGLKINTLPMPLSSFQALDMDDEEFSHKLFSTLSKYLDIKKPRAAFSEMMVELSKAIAETKPQLLETIEFRSGSPEEDGWNLVADNPDDRLPEFCVVIDGYWGKILKIHPTGNYFMDRAISEAEFLTKVIELIIKPGKWWVVYAKIQIVSQDDSIKREVWLAFQLGAGSPKPLEDGEFEWSIYRPPKTVGGNWVKIDANLAESVKNTFGIKGWKYSKLLGFRIRGKLSISKIKMYG